MRLQPSKESFVNAVLGDLKHQGVSVHIDDIVVHTDDDESYIRLLRIVFERLRQANLYMNMNKSRFLCPSVIYLGHEIGHGRISIDENIRNTFKELTCPFNVKGVRRFMGTVGYFRKFVPHFAK